MFNLPSVVLSRALRKATWHSDIMYIYRFGQECLLDMLHPDPFIAADALWIGPFDRGAQSSSYGVAWKNLSHVMPSVSNPVFDPGSFPEKSFDMILINMWFCGENDIFFYLSSILKLLKSSGLIRIILPVAGTLNHVRASITEAERVLYGGAHPWGQVFPESRELATVIQGLGLKNALCDMERLSIKYKNIYQCLGDLRSMGGLIMPLQGAKGLRSPHFFRVANDYFMATFDGMDTFECAVLSGTTMS